LGKSLDFYVPSSEPDTTWKNQIGITSHPGNVPTLIDFSKHPDAQCAQLANTLTIFPQ
jgi:hypothetical protein